MIKKKKVLQFTALLILTSASCAEAYSQVRQTEALVVDSVTRETSTVSGKIIDSRTGRPIIGAGIAYRDLAARITGSDGSFSMDIPEDKNAVLHISMEGYTTKIVPAVFGQPMKVTIYPADYASVYKTTSSIFGANDILKTTGAQSKTGINAWESNTETFDSYLQGRFAGLAVTRRSGTPSIGANLQVRNFNSLYASNQPLYVVDGVVYNTDLYSPSITTGHINNPMQHIDVRDIQDVALLKDAVSSAIYGARAANGVIVINTNHAKELATRIDYQGNVSYGFSPASIPMMEAYAYRSYLNDVLATSPYTGDEIAAMPFNNDSEIFEGYHKYHNENDWQSLAFRNTVNNNHFLRVTGGDDIAKYALSLGYNDIQGVTDNTGQKKYTARFNGNMKLGDKLTAQTNIAVGYGLQNLKDQGPVQSTNPIFLSLIKAPFLYHQEVAADGTISPNYDGADYFGYSNPMQIIHNGNNDKKAYRMMASVVLDYKFNNRFSLTNLLSVTYDKAQENFFVPRKGVAMDTVRNLEVFSRLGAQVARYFAISNDMRLNYNQSIGTDNHLQVIGGVRYHIHDGEQDYALGYNSATDHLISIGNSTASSRMYGGHIGKWANMTGYALGNLTLQNKYILNASISVDGSSRFGNRVAEGIKINDATYGVFPAVGAGWLLSNEDFLRGHSTINLLKLRASYGLVGNDDIGNFAARRNYISQNFLGMQGLVRDDVANPFLKWETVEKINAGMDLSLWQERLNLMVDIYQQTTHDMLVYNQGNSMSGIAYYLYNNGKMRSTGIDVALSGRIIDSRVKWDAGLNLGTFRNKVLAIPETSFTSFAGGTFITQVGEVANSFYGYKFDGIYHTQQEAEAADKGIHDIAGNKVPFQAGDAQFLDRNNDGIIDEQDRFILGSPNPDLYGGFSNTISYKNWKFNALFTFSLGNEVFNYTRAQLESGSSFYNQTELMLQRWRVDGQDTNVPRVSYNDPMGNARFSDRWIEDGSYLRLRQLSVEYSLPIDKQIVKYLKFYGTANNLFTLTTYLGHDPEFAFGADIFHQGVDVALEPQVRSVQVGVRLGL